MSALALLAKRRFLPLFICQFFGAFNDNVFKNALIVFITYRLVSDGSSPAVFASIASGVFIFPFFIFSALAGQITDKFDKAYIARLIKLFEIVIVVMAIASFFYSDIYLLLSVLFLLGIHSAFFGPVKYSILPQLLHKPELLAANGLVSAGTFVAILLGTLVGGITVTQEPYGKYMVSIVLLVAALIGWLSSMQIPKCPSADSELKIDKNILRSTLDVMKVGKGNHHITVSRLCISWFWLLGASILALFPAFTKDYLKGDATVSTLFLFLFSVGIGVGSLITNRILKGEINAKFVPISCLIISGLIFDIFLWTSYKIDPTITSYMNLSTFLAVPENIKVVIHNFLISVTAGFYIVPLMSIIQSEAKPDERSRVIAANNIMNSLFMVASAVFSALFLGFGGTIPQYFSIIAIVNILVGLYALNLLPYASLRKIARVILKFLFRVEVKGAENYYKAGKRAVIIPNHVSFLDAPLLSTFLPEEVTFAINLYIARRWWVKPALKFVKVFSMDPANPMATKYLIDEVKKDKNLVIFPEGRITVTGSMMKIYEGPAMIADRAEAMLLPVKIEGAQYSGVSRITKKVKWRWFPKITITILPPVRLNAPQHIKGRARRKAMGNMLYDIMSTAMYEATPKDKTIYQSILDAACTHGFDKKILTDVERKQITYRKLITGSLVLGKLFAKQTEKKDYVGILLPNMAGTAVTFFALQAFGRVPAMLNFSTGLNNILHSIKIANIKVVLTSKRFIEAAKFQHNIEEIEKVCKVIYLDELAKTISKLSKICGLIKSYTACKHYKKQAKDMSANDPAVVLFTSGSEGVPKGVVLSHMNVQSNRIQLAARVDFGPTDSVFNSLPIFHSFGLTAGMILPLTSGIKVFFYPTPLHYRLIPEVVYESNSTIMFGTDTFLAAYGKFANPYDFYSVRYIFAGAEKLKPETRQLWTEKFGIRVFEGYGATETAPVIAVNTPIHNKAGTVGRMMPGMEYHLKPVDGIENAGKLLVKGPNIMLGYLDQSGSGKINPPTDSDKGEGWYDTGDIVAIDEGGFIEIKGRAKRFAKVAGEMVSLIYVEDFFARHWPKNRHAVMAIPDVKKGEQLALVTDKAEITRSEIVEAASKDKIAELFLPRKIIHVKTLPELATGKLNYPEIQKILEKELEEKS